MKVQEIIAFLETIAPASLQESYDNAGLITGDTQWDCSGVITTLDVTEAVVLEAIEKKCNLIVAHHPIIFRGLKKITGKNYVEKTVIAAIKNDIAIYAIHTNLDNVLEGVNGRMADKLGLINRKLLVPKTGLIKKLVTYAPLANAGEIRNALFAAGAGGIGNYSECCFSAEGEGSFKAGNNASPFIGKIGERHIESEMRIETIFPAWSQNKVLEALKRVHPYEEVAYDISTIDNEHQGIGSGLIGELKEPILPEAFLQHIKNYFNLKLIRHTQIGDTQKPISRIAICGGAGSFLIPAAIQCGAEFYITADIKYHEFFDAEEKLVIADIGHYESEQYTIDLLFDVLREKFLNFAVLKTGVKTNPVNYFV